MTGRRMTGLSKHRIELLPAAPPAPEVFEVERADRLIKEASAQIHSSCPTGAGDWLYEERMDLVQGLRRAEAAVDAAYSNQDMADLKLKLAELLELYRQAWQAFEERPKVEQVQGDLFG